MELERSSGILLHITSLPSAYGIGDLGPEAYKFIDFVKASGNTWWQLLPLNPTYEKYNHSPYSSDSAFAGNPLLISPEVLEEQGYLNLKDFAKPKISSAGKVEFKKAGEFKEEILDAAFIKFKSKKKPAAYNKFCKEHAYWLEDYSFFRALAGEYSTSWASWPEGLRDREVASIKKVKKDFGEEIEKVKFIQYIFFSQWKKLIDYAHYEGVKFIGDIPFYITHDSADIWAHQAYFKLDNKKEPTHLSGVPPDYYSKTGQLWGTPVYDWKALKSSGYDWWIERIRQNLFLFDLVRLDHFRAFAAYWEVPAGEKTAIKGKWAKTPGNDFFRIVKKEFPEMPLIAEDLGLLDEPVYKLLEKFNFPGMKVLHFAFGEEKRDNPYLPFNHTPHSIVYTGTHDNNTSKGWYNEADKEAREHLAKISGNKVTTENAHEVLHKLALGSVSKLAIVPMQDILGLGKEGLMNIPGSIKGNWTWRMEEGKLKPNLIKKLRELNELYGRKEIPKKKLKKKSKKK
ncbi:MAG TPA: 4-alpha-glucanotransferase [Gillisia sp.]|nr:4-alpha-glucanotransferase [Gillisia sp.]